MAPERTTPDKTVDNSVNVASNCYRGQWCKGCTWNPAINDQDCF